MKNIAINTAVISMLTLGSASAAITLTNGGFEDSTDFLTGWTGTGIIETANPLDGATSAKNLAAYQNITDSSANGLANFELNFMVKLDTINDSQRVRLRNFGTAGDMITLRFTGSGVSAYSGVWSLVKSSTITAGTDYYVRITGKDLDDQNTRSYDVGISTDGTTYTTGTSTTFHGYGTGKFGSLRFESATGGATWDAVTVVAVPEPSSAALLGLGGIALILRRKK